MAKYQFNRQRVVTETIVIEIDEELVSNRIDEIVDHLHFQEFPWEFDSDDDIEVVFIGEVEDAATMTLVESDLETEQC